jgi:hypothetical protein
LLSPVKFVLKLAKFIKSHSKNQNQKYFINNKNKMKINKSLSTEVNYFVSKVLNKFVYAYDSTIN